MTRSIITAHSIRSIFAEAIFSARLCHTDIHRRSSKNCFQVRVRVILSSQSVYSNTQDEFPAHLSSISVRMQTKRKLWLAGAKKNLKSDRHVEPRFLKQTRCAALATAPVEHVAIALIQWTSVYIETGLTFFYDLLL